MELKARGSKSAVGALLEPLGIVGDPPRGESHFDRGHRDLFVLLFSPVLGPINAISVARQNEEVRQEALGACLETRVLVRMLGPEHPDVARSLDSLADRYASWKGFAEADVLRERALSIREKIFGPESSEVATNLRKLAFRLRGEGRYEEAEPFYQRALAVGEKAWGSEHPEQAWTLADYAQVLRRLGRRAEADEMEARATAITAKHYPNADAEKTVP